MKQAALIPILKFQSQSLPFTVQTIQDLWQEQDDLHQGPHSHNHYEMIWLTRGSGTLYLDMQHKIVASNSIFCLKPNQAHQFRIDPEMEGFVFTFTDSLFRMDEYDASWTSLANIFQLFTDGQPVRIDGELEEDMKEVVLLMRKEVEKQHSFKMELLKRYFKIFLIYLTSRLPEYIQSTEQSREAELVKSFVELLDKNFKEKKMVADYATQLFITPNYLNRIVKKNTGVSAGHLIRERVVLEAKRLGRYSAAGMKEIAYSLGFLDSAHFSRFFKTFGGTNFSEFKRTAVVIPFDAGKNRA